jgi:hypothetical protein
VEKVDLGVQIILKNGDNMARPIGSKNNKQPISTRLVKMTIKLLEKQLEDSKAKTKRLEEELTKAKRFQLELNK